MCILHCEQYLIFFAEFLKNIDISAVTEISHVAGKILFSVTPNSEKVALEQIRQALNIYLELPNAFSIVNTLNQQLNPNVHQLLANIHHLNGQLMLANAQMQLQMQTIDNMRASIGHQNQVDSSVLPQSLICSSVDIETILRGTVTLTNIDVKLFQINMPCIYRQIMIKLSGN